MDERHPFAPDARRHALTLLTRLSQRSSQAGGWLALGLEHRLAALSETALEVAVETEGEIASALARRLEVEGSREIYGTIAKLCDGERFQRSVALREVALAATSKFLDSLITELSPMSDLVAGEVFGVAINLGVRLNDVGRYDEALQVLLTNLRRQARLAVEPSTDRVEALATALNALGHSLSSVGRHADALLVLDLALEGFTTLEEDHPGCFATRVAMCLNNLSDRLARAGRHGEAMEAARKAVELNRQWAKDREAVFSPDLAGSLNTLGLRHDECGEIGKALAAFQESERIFRELKDDLPDSFRPDYAMCLTNLGSLFRRVGILDQALPRAEQAVALYRELVAQQTGAFGVALAGALINSSHLLDQCKRWKEALDQSQEAVQILRSAKGDQRADLAEALDTLSRSLSRFATPEEFLPLLEEALALRRVLAAEAPDLREPQLAGTLGNYAFRLAQLGRHAEALPAISEAIRLLTPHVAPALARYGGWALGMMNQYLEVCMALEVDPDPGLFAGITEAFDRWDTAKEGGWSKQI